MDFRRLDKNNQTGIIQEIIQRLGTDTGYNCLDKIWSNGLIVKENATYCGGKKINCGHDQKLYQYTL